ncbi:hypothetical protein [Desulfotomaculum nigrificans]|uniref:hypothetical protein n=1 Tax=Desulfotomaculum nigrificans TaxID=1565 RepID=UPI0012DCF0A4|nr:hypothetical protein [Desulfotomaculum nigrificans]
MSIGVFHPAKKKSIAYTVKGQSQVIRVKRAKNSLLNTFFKNSSQLLDYLVIGSAQLAEFPSGAAVLPVLFLIIYPFSFCPPGEVYRSNKEYGVKFTTFLLINTTLMAYNLFSASTELSGLTPKSGLGQH